LYGTIKEHSQDKIHSRMLANLTNLSDILHWSEHWGSEMAQQFTVHAAKTHLSKLIEAALAGDEIVIAKGNKPVVRLVAITPTKFKIGLLEGQLGSGPDFLEPMNERELEDWEGSA